MKQMIKQKLLLFFCLLIFITSKSQNASFNTQYLFNLLQVNPAYSGTSERIEMIAGTKLQWLGFEGAPVTHYLSASTLLGSSNLGIGGTLNHERIGNTRTTNLYLDFSYHVQLYKDQYLSFGMKGGASFFTVNPNEVDVLDSDDDLLQGSGSSISGNIGLGVFYYSETVYLGASVPHFYRSSEQVVSNGTTSFQVSNPTYLIAGNIIYLNDNLKTRPSILYRIDPNLSNVLDINNQLIFKDKFSLGLGYRTSDELVFITQLELNKAFKFGYSFNYPLSSAKNFSTFHTHELLVRYSFLKKSSIYVSPRFF